MVSVRSIFPALALAVPLTFVLSSGCNDDGTIGKDEAADAAARTICNLYFECDCADHMDPDWFSSQEQCEADQKAETQKAIDEGDAAGLTYNGQCVTDILNFLENLGCVNGSNLSLNEWVALLEVEQCKFFHGDRTGGQSCSPLQESNGDDCVEDHWCDVDVCVPFETYPGPGDSCETQFSSVCTGGAICLDLEGTGTNECHVLPGSGDTCLGQADLCGEGLACDQASKTCASAPGEGEACAIGSLSPCAQGLVCDSMNCVAAPVGGEDCIANQCAAGFSCEGGTCVDEIPLACGAADLG